MWLEICLRDLRYFDIPCDLHPEPESVSYFTVGPTSQHPGWDSLRGGRCNPIESMAVLPH